MQDLLATALDAPTGKRSLDVPTRRLRGSCARRDAWQRLGDGACSRHATAPVRAMRRRLFVVMFTPRLGAAHAAPWRLQPCARRTLAPAHAAAARYSSAAWALAPVQRRIKGRGG
jgi:hypothetical protein